MTALSPPEVFYVRLLNEKVSAHVDVEWFFRNIVDEIAVERGFKFIQMNHTKPKGQWMNVEIFEAIRKASIVIADLTGLRANCFTELGYAFGLGKPVIMTFQEGTSIPFDTSAVEGFPWDRKISTRKLKKNFNAHWDKRMNLPPLASPALIL